MFLAMDPSGTLAHGKHLLIDLVPYASQFSGCLVLGAPIPLQKRKLSPGQQFPYVVPCPGSLAANMPTDARAWCEAQSAWRCPGKARALRKLFPYEL